MKTLLLVFLAIIISAFNITITLAFGVSSLFNIKYAAFKVRKVSVFKARFMPWYQYRY